MLKGRGQALLVMVATYMASMSWLVLAATLLAASVSAAAPMFPAVGSSWSTRVVKDGGAPRLFRWRVLDDGTFDDRPVFRVAVGRDTVVLYHRETRSWIAALTDGLVRRAARPHEGDFAWPLTVGKHWSHAYTSLDVERAGRAGSQSRPRQGTWVVEAFEPVDVPAGRFETFRVKGTWTGGPGITTTRTCWYAPRIGLIVRSITERTSDTGTETEVTDLVKYSVKPRSAPVN